MPGRQFNSSNYRYGFNGQEKDDDIKNIIGSLNTAEFWEYDPRTGRRWNADPITKPWESPYATFSNNPIYFSDISGSQSEESSGGGNFIRAPKNDDSGERFYKNQEKPDPDPRNMGPEVTITAHRPNVLNNIKSGINKIFKVAVKVLGFVWNVLAQKAGIQVYGSGTDDLGDKAGKNVIVYQSFDLKAFMDIMGIVLEVFPESTHPEVLKPKITDVGEKAIDVAKEKPELKVTKANEVEDKLKEQSKEAHNFPTISGAKSAEGIITLHTLKELGAKKINGFWFNKDGSLVNWDEVIPEDRPKAKH